MKEKISVKLEADANAFNKSINEALKNSKLYGEATQKSIIESNKKLGFSFDVSAESIRRYSTGLMGLPALITGAFGAYAINSISSSARELENMARIAGMSTEEFQAAAFATNQMGVSADQLADISKDVREKLGEFVDTGGGGFKDFFEQVAPKINMTAEELRGLSGTDALEKMVHGMDDAGLSADQMSFYLESVGNDATKLIPLFENNSSKLQTLENRFDDVAGAVKDFETKKLSDMKTEIDLATESATRFATGLAVQVEPVVTRIARATAEMFAGFNRANTVAGIMAEAEAQAIDKTTEAIQKKTSVYDEAEQKYQLQLQQQMNSYKAFTGENRKRADEIIAATEAKIAAVQKMRDEATKPIAPVAIPEIPGSVISSTETANAIESFANKPSPGLSQSDIEQQALLNEQWLEQLEQRIMGEKELIDAQAVAERDRVRREISDEDQKQQALFLIKKNWQKKIGELRQKEAEEIKRQQQAELAARARLFGDMADLTGAFAGEQSSAYKAMFAASKAFSIAETMSASFPAIMKAWASAPFPANMAAVATTTMETGALTAAAKAVQLTGIAHSGIDKIPKEGTWLLEKGERVLSPMQNADLTSYLSDKNNRTDSQGLTINIQNAPEGTTADYDAVNQIVTIAVAESEKNLTNQIVRGGGRFMAAGKRHLNWKREPSR